MFKHNTQVYSCKLEVKHVFELTKQQDDKRFKKDLGNRMLLLMVQNLQTQHIDLERAFILLMLLKKQQVMVSEIFKQTLYLFYFAIWHCVIHFIKFDYDCNAGNLPMENHSTWGKARCYPPENLMLKCLDCLMQKFQLVCLNLQTFRIHLCQSAMNLQFMMMLESGQSIQSN